MSKPLDRRPRDPNQLGKLMVDIMSGEVKDTISPKKKAPASRMEAGVSDHAWSLEEIASLSS